MPHAAAPVIGRISAAPGANVRRVWSENFRAVRAETERRAAQLSPEDQNVQSMADASPTKWHRAHTTWFFETFLLKPHRRELPRIRRAFRIPVQLLLCCGRPPVCTAGARTDYPSEFRGGGRLSRSCRCRGRPASGQCRSGDAGKNRFYHRDWFASRAAASGTDAHRHPARVCAEPDRSRL